MRPTTTTTPLTRIASRASIIEAAVAVGYRTITRPFCAPTPPWSRGHAPPPQPREITHHLSERSQRQFPPELLRGEKALRSFAQFACGSGGLGGWSVSP